MSDTHVRSLVDVQSEYLAAQEAIGYVVLNWQRDSVIRAIKGGLEDFQHASDDLEAIFLIRLFSVFEGILKEHLAQHHPSIHVPEEARSVWLIDRVAQRQPRPITFPLRQRVHEVRRYRNFLVHPHGPSLPVLFFPDALAPLSKFVERLPEPR